MPGRFEPVAFEPHGRRRSGRWVPRWLLLLALGIAAGAGGMLCVQERVLPPRLSADESRALRDSLSQATNERQQLRVQLDDRTQRLEGALADRDKLAEQLKAGNDDLAELRADQARLLAALPADPRGGAIAIRSARFSAEGGSLAYDVVLTRDRVGNEPLAGSMQFVVAGAAGRGAENRITSEPIDIAVDDFESLRGSVPLPDGFTPRQATVTVHDRADGKRLGMRIFNLR